MNKKLFIGSIILIITTGIFADGNRVQQNPKPPYSKLSSPPIQVTDAYSLAIKVIGGETNHYYCITATCLNPLPERINSSGNNSGWLFGFSNTNGAEKQVAVYFDRIAIVVSTEGPFGK